MRGLISLKKTVLIMKKKFYKFQATLTLTDRLMNAEFVLR